MTLVKEAFGCSYIVYLILRFCLKLTSCWPLADIAGFCSGNSWFLRWGEILHQTKQEHPWTMLSPVMDQYMPWCNSVLRWCAYFGVWARWLFVLCEQHWVAKRSSGKWSQTCWGFCTRSCRSDQVPLSDWMRKSRTWFEIILASCILTSYEHPCPLF